MEKIEVIIYTLHKKYNLHNIFLFILCFSNIFYLLYLLAIAYHNVIIVDDYWFMAIYKRYGMIGSISWWYHNWQGRFSAQLFTNIIVKSYELVHSLLPYTIFLICFFIYSIVRIFKQLLPSTNEHIKYYPLLILNYSVFLFNLFLISNFEFSTFYWINVSAMYFGGIVFALIATGELISKSKSIHSYFLICIGVAYAGSSSEHFGAVCTLVLAIYIVFIKYRHSLRINDVLINVLLKKAVLAFLICMISFLIMILAPGNDIRRAAYPKPSITEASITGLKSLFYLFAVLISEKAKYLILLSFPFIYLGTILRKKEVIDEFKTILIIAGSLPVFVILLYICLLPSAYAISDIGPFRALTHIAFILTSYVAVVSFVIGYKTQFSKKLAFIFSIICCLFFTLISRDRIKINLPDTVEYTKSEERRINKLRALKAVENKQPVTLDSIYQSPKNVLWFVEIGKDSKVSYNHYINSWISNGLELGFEIKVKDK